VVLSDRSIRREIGDGRIVIDPYDETLVQPSSVDVRVDGAFRVFHNSRYTHIDVRERMDDLTELVRKDGDEPFIRRSSASRCPTTWSRGSRARARSGDSAC
jgi:dCTP deaminase